MTPGDTMAERKLSEIVGKHYDEFWKTRKMYRVLKGAKGCKKSKTCALWYIYNMMKYPQANLLVIRKVFGTLQQSCYTDLLWAIDQFGVSDYWKGSVAPLQLTYLPTGQVIIFRGLDDPLKLASITVRKGYLCWVWFEEAFEIPNEDAFDKIAFSIRGLIPPETGLWKQFTFTFNPWSERTWLKARFFDKEDPDVFAETKTYKDNEFLGPDDLARYAKMYKTNPRAARVYCDGEWGISEGLIYTNWHEEDFDWRDIADQEGVRPAFGLDFGYAVSYNAFCAILVDVERRKLWVYDEMYERGLSNIDIAKKICQLGYGKEEIWADSAEPKSIYELQNGFTEEVVDDNGRYQLVHWQLPAIRPAMKGPDSLMNGIQRAQSFEIIVHPRCVNFITELNNYCYDTDKDGNFTDKPIKDFDHLMDSFRYALTKFFVKGRGHVYEAKGIDTGMATQKRRSRRVISS